jgi:hydrogenase nickel incorporation protein HypA/HybF
MHEFSLAQSLMQLVEESARQEAITHVRRVTVVVGEWSAVMPDALAGSFAILAADSGGLFTDAELQVTQRAAHGECNVCGQQFPAEEGGLFCPGCGAAAHLISGNELYVDSYEGD